MFIGCKFLLEALRGRLSVSSEMAPVVMVFFMRDTAATEPRTGLARASSLLALFIYTKEHKLLTVKTAENQFSVKGDTSWNLTFSMFKYYNRVHGASTNPENVKVTKLWHF